MEWGVFVMGVSLQSPHPPTPPPPLTPLSPSTHAFARTHWCRLICHMAWAMKGQQKRAKEVSGILYLCVCVFVRAHTMHQKETKQTAKGARSNR